MGKRRARAESPDDIAWIMLPLQATAEEIEQAATGAGFTAYELACFEAYKVEGGDNWTELARLAFGLPLRARADETAQRCFRSATHKLRVQLNRHPERLLRLVEAESGIFELRSNWYASLRRDLMGM